MHTLYIQCMYRYMYLNLYKTSLLCVYTYINIRIHIHIYTSVYTRALCQLVIRHGFRS